MIRDLMNPKGKGIFSNSDDENGFVPKFPVGA
jgi:hypothetical protein